MRLLDRIGWVLFATIVAARRAWSATVEPEPEPEYEEEEEAHVWDTLGTYPCDFDVPATPEARLSVLLHISACQRVEEGYFRQGYYEPS